MQIRNNKPSQQRTKSTAGLWGNDLFRMKRFWTKVINRRKKKLGQ